MSDKTVPYYVYEGERARAEICIHQMRAIALVSAVVCALMCSLALITVNNAHERAVREIEASTQCTCTCDTTTEAS